MHMQEPTPEMVRTWKMTYATYRTRLKPDNKPIEEVISYLKRKYPVTELHEHHLKRIVLGNVTENEYYRDKIPDNKTPIPSVFKVENTSDPDRIFKE
jgi:hypothetical protein